MGKALYRKYRSKNLDEIIGQPHITQTLQNALSQGSFSHAYLFTGPRGIGKTSIARILAHEVNGLPYDEDSTHLDIIEIDAASNRRIDEIRELRDKVHIAPTSAKYKVYIIDEVHMLTKEAFNALLKTLEEPPEHVIFILATTESHKLPETIISRTQRFTFKPVDKDTAVAHLRSIAEKEKLTIEDDALELIAQHGGGSFRDSISLLDQVRGKDSDVTLTDVQAMLGIAPKETVETLIATLRSGDAKDVLSHLQVAREQGYQAGQLAKQLAASLRQHLIDGSLPVSSNDLIRTLQALVAVPAAFDPQAALEIALLDVVIDRQLAETPSPPQITSVEIVTTPAKTTKPAPKATEVEQPTMKPAAKSATAVSVHAQLDEATWKAVLDSIKQTHNTLYSVARMATPQINGDEIILVFKFPFHQKRLSETKNKQIITNLASEAVGKPVTITCIIGSAEQPTQQTENPTPTKGTSKDAISTISNIFGGAEVIE